MLLIDDVKVQPAGSTWLGRGEAETAQELGKCPGRGDAEILPFVETQRRAEDTGRGRQTRLENGINYRWGMRRIRETSTL